MGRITVNMKSGIILLLLFFILVNFTIPVWADSYQFEETPLYWDGNAGSIKISPEGRLFVIDRAIELWSVNATTGEYIDYFPIGASNLADITFKSNSEIWWADNVRGFGYSDLTNLLTSEWSIPENPFNEDPNLGPIMLYDNKVWLPTWFGSTYGLFQFNPTTKNLCLYAVTNGLFAADITELNDQLWMLDWRGDEANNQLLVFNPSNSSFIRYNLVRNIGDDAQIFVYSEQLWWVEDQNNGAIVKFIPGLNNQGEMTIYSLPEGSYPRNLFVQGNQVWYSDVNGAFGHLDTTLVSGTTSVITGSDPITLSCESSTNLGTPDPYEFYIYDRGTFTWSTQNSTVDTTNIGLQVYQLPELSSAYGIAVQGDYVWVTDPGSDINNKRQKLIRMPIEPINPSFQIFLPLLLK